MNLGAIFQSTLAAILVSLGVLPCQSRQVALPVQEHGDIDSQRKKLDPFEIRESDELSTIDWYLSGEDSFAGVKAKVNAALEKARNEPSKGNVHDDIGRMASSSGLSVWSNRQLTAFDSCAGLTGDESTNCQLCLYYQIPGVVRCDCTSFSSTTGDGEIKCYSYDGCSTTTRITQGHATVGQTDSRCFEIFGSNNLLCAGASCPNIPCTNYEGTVVACPVTDSGPCSCTDNGSCNNGRARIDFDCGAGITGYMCAAQVRGITLELFTCTFPVPDPFDSATVTDSPTPMSIAGPDPTQSPTPGAPNIPPTTASNPTPHNMPIAQGTPTTASPTPAMETKKSQSPMAEGGGTPTGTSPPSGGSMQTMGTVAVGALAVGSFLW